MIAKESKSKILHKPNSRKKKYIFFVIATIFPFLPFVFDYFEKFYFALYFVKEALEVKKELFLFPLMLSYIFVSPSLKNFCSPLFRDFFFERRKTKKK